MPTETVPARVARRFLLAGQGLLDDPARAATPTSVYRQIERMGFVQVDSIHTVERAHHHILMSRFDGYRHALLTGLLEQRRKLFEHWTHDASLVPAVWLPYWRHRFDRYAARMRARARATKRRPDGLDALLDEVRRRIADEGPLRSADFDDTRDAAERGTAGFWNWKPHKAALEWLWRTGELAITRREAFQKVYDLCERVFPALAAAPPPSADEHLDWACRSAFARLEVASPAEIAHFFDAIGIAEARAWCVAAVARGELVPVAVAAVDGSAPRPAFACADWRARAARLPEAPARTRLLSPFDPVIRDRARTLRRFGFDYRIEVFVPAPQRRYGYYVLPILEGERFVGRLDPRFARDRGVLELNALFWEPGVRATPARVRGVMRALERLAEQLGARDVELGRRARRALSAPRPLRRPASPRGSVPAPSPPSAPGRRVAPGSPRRHPGGTRPRRSSP